MRSQKQTLIAPALVQAFVDCPNCGLVPKPTGHLLVAVQTPGLHQANCNVTCDRCGSPDAMLYLERELASRH